MKKLITVFLFLLQPVFPFNLPTLYFTPNKQTDKIILSVIESAESSVYIAGYSVSWDKLTEIIAKKQGRVDIRVLTDVKTNGIAEDIAKTYDTSGLFHPKFITIDGDKVFTGSGNFTDNGLHLHHNHFLFIQDKNIANFFNQQFLVWWEEVSADIKDNKPKKLKGSSSEIYQDEIYKICFSPGTDGESVIIQEISKAKKTIHFAHYRLASEEIAKAVVGRKLAGVKVNGIMDASGIEPYSVFYPLSDYSCALKRSNLAGFLHDKLFIIDGETVVTGSYNPTVSAKKNQECIIVIKDRSVAQRLLNEWRGLWLFHSLP